METNGLHRAHPLKPDSNAAVTMLTEQKNTNPKSFGVGQMSYKRSEGNQRRHLWRRHP